MVHVYTWMYCENGQSCNDMTKYPGLYFEITKQLPYSECLF